MHHQWQRPRARLGPACPGGQHPSAQIRNPMFTLSRGSFYFHFQNLLRAHDRHTTILCCRVERVQKGLVDRIVFRNQVGGLHAELCFIYWFYDQELLPREECQLTWYMSWSSCPNCADHVARFLAEHSNISLTIFVARVYYNWASEYQCGLRRLCQEGAQLEAMSFQEFEDCYEEFVGEPFRPWKGLYSNYTQQENMLRKILGTVSLLKEETFLFQFNNRHRVPRHCGPRRPRRKTYLCYLLARPGDATAPTKGCLQNKKGHHAEICFIKRIRSLGLDPSQDYLITCYLTWSPCLDCAFKLAKLKKDFPRLTLRIFISRLYFHWIRKFQKGLQQLWLSGALVAIMGLQEFTDCWNNFVNHQQSSFTPWDKLDAYSKNIRGRLGRILRSWGCGPTPPSEGSSR
ncbi:DNA dC-_dU-editing enzyme APOBEC-3-like isoform 2-T2 [Thomomys bottae]